jgi:hypothetical protein
VTASELKRLIVFVLTLMVGSVGLSSGLRASSIEVFEYGIYTAKVESQGTGMNETMKYAGVSQICHVMTTSVVPNRDNLQFGFRFRVHGSTSGAPVDFRRVFRWPDHLKPPTLPVTYVTNESVERYQVDQTSYWGWSNWQTRPGVWTFQIFEMDRKLAEMVFTVVDKDEIKVRPDGDSTCFQMSERKGAMKWHWT